MMTVEAARQLRDEAVCFVGIGLAERRGQPGAAHHAPEIVLIYESGTIGAKPDVLPLSIGDGEFAETADTVVSMPEIFRYWLQGGRVDVGFLGAAQIDRFANINTTVVGDYASESAAARRWRCAGNRRQAGEVFIMLRQSPSAFVAKLDFVTSVGYLDGGDARERLGLPGRGPTKVITDLGVITPDPTTRELTLTQLHPGVTVEQVLSQTGWPLKVAKALQTTTARRPPNLKRFAPCTGGRSSRTRREPRHDPVFCI